MVPTTTTTSPTPTTPGRTTSALRTASLMLMASTVTVAEAAMMTTEYLPANGYNFTCTVFKHTSSNPNAPQKDIMLLHGFPYNREWWNPLLEQWDAMLSSGEEVVATSRNGGGKRLLASPPPYDVSIHAVACDLRGYSLGASPDDVEEYTTTKFADDVNRLAIASGFDNGFHLMGHDHGGGLGWYMAANDNTQGGILSFVSMSIPHIQLFSDAMCGPKQDQDQVVAGNYINQMALEDSAYANDGGLYKTYKLFFAAQLGSTDQAQFQKWLWWYVAMEKLLSVPPVASEEEVDAYDGQTFFIDAVRKAIPLESTNGECDVKDDIGVGAVRIPTLLICGSNDPAILCSRPFAYDYDPAADFLPDYEHVNYECGHNFFGKNDCDSMEETQAVMDKINSFVLGGDTPNKRYQDESLTSAGAASYSSRAAFWAATTALLWIAL